MSQTVLERGTVTPVTLTDEQAKAELARLGENMGGYDTPQEALYTETDEYLDVEPLGLCRLTNFTTGDADYLCEIKKNTNGSLDFTVIYYNGGAGLMEVLEEGLKG